jgi:hypothetical protein
MTDAAKDDLLDADRTFLTETEALLKIYEAMHWLRARVPIGPLGEGIVWAREISTPKWTIGIAATRESLGAKSLHIRRISAPGDPFVMVDKDVVDLAGLTPVLEKLIGNEPALGSVRRQRRRLPHSRKRRP